MSTYTVLDHEFRYLGQVQAYSASAALRKALRQWPHSAPMVELWS